MSEELVCRQYCWMSSSSEGMPRPAKSSPSRPGACSQLHVVRLLKRTLIVVKGLNVILDLVHVVSYMYMLCLEYRVSWVRVPPEAAHFF